MTVNHKILATFPETFMAISGLSVAAFDALLVEIAPAYAAAELIRKARTDRRNAVGAGAPPRLTLADGVLATLLKVRFGAKWEVGMILGVSLDTIVRVARRLKPILSASSAIGLLVPLSVPERQSSLLVASRQLPHFGGYLRLLGYRCSIWLDDHGGVWPIGRIDVLTEVITQVMPAFRSGEPVKYA